MQILMGVEYTLVTIDESKVYTKNLLHYIYTNYPSLRESRNSIFLKHSFGHHHYHVFLLKWLYALYIKVNHHNIQNFKEVLIERAHKPIKISFKNANTKPIDLNVKVIENRYIEFLLHKDEIYYFKKVSKIFSEYPYIKVADERFVIDLEDECTALQEIHSFFKINFKTIKFLYKNLFELQNVLKENPSHKTFNQSVCNALSLLNSDENDSLDVITSKYKKLLKTYHPDKVYKQANEIEYKEKFQMIQNAYYLVKEEFGT